MTNTIKKETINYAAAMKIVDAAIKKAKALGCKQNVAVVDDGGRLVAFARMDGAPIIGIDGCQKKAFTALFGVGTHHLFDMIKDDPSVVHGLSHFPNATLIGGGMPIVINDQVVGGVGVGGGMVDEDIACAQAGIDAL
ncbi:MAG: heme-binding protein [Pseudomonadota bacterium]